MQVWMKPLEISIDKQKKTSIFPNGCTSGLPRLFSECGLKYYEISYNKERKERKKSHLLLNFSDCKNFSNENRNSPNGEGVTSFLEPAQNGLTLIWLTVFWVTNFIYKIIFLILLSFEAQSATGGLILTNANIDVIYGENKLSHSVYLWDCSTWNPKTEKLHWEKKY